MTDLGDVDGAEVDQRNCVNAQASGAEFVRIPCQMQSSFEVNEKEGEGANPRGGVYYHVESIARQDCTETPQLEPDHC